MIFNSLDFAVFLPIVFMLFWTLKKDLKLQNLLLIISSYVFYGWWNWKFLILIIGSTLLDFIIGNQLRSSESPTKRKTLLYTSIIANLGVLAVFKYYNFFAENFVEAFTFLGSPIQIQSLDLILPVGISFYTFQTMSYTIDVYYKNIEPTKDILAFGGFVSFFPQLVAGPIERAKNLLPQFYVEKDFDAKKATDGLRQMLWGLFKKIVIADGCAEFANQIFDNHANYNGSTLVLGALFFTFQIYGDFSGYTDIAIGTSKLFGFDLKRNFAFPYFSRSVAEFWRRWHISLSSWFKDYVYFPLGGSKGSMLMQVRNIFIIFILSGFWHGANWTFIAWGGLNALLIIPSIVLKTNRNNMETINSEGIFASIKDLIGMAITFPMIVLTWILFRAENMTHAGLYLSKIFSGSTFSVPFFIGRKEGFIILGITLLFMIIEWFGRDRKYALENLGTWNKYLRYPIYYIILFLIFWFGGSQQEFIYFQF